MEPDHCETLQQLLTVDMLMDCSYLLAGLPALPVKESASTLRMDIRALMAWTDRHKPVSVATAPPLKLPSAPTPF